MLSGVTIASGYADGSYPYYAGGGMFNNNASPTLTDCTFRGNEAYDGGGMYNTSSASPTMTNCTISGNAAFSGGGISNISSASPTVKNCTISGNTASSSGGGIINNFSSPTVKNCTISGNTASSRGGGMSNYSSSPTVTNCILWGNTASSGDEVYDDESTPVFSYCNIQGSGGSSSWDTDLGTDNGGNIDEDPLFVRDPGTNGSDDTGDLHLTASSPCVDAGVNGSFTTDDTDVDGETRIFNGTIDIGADEFVDTDGDGTSDYEDADDDNDGISDEDEAALGTDPKDADSDGDGYDDGAEVLRGSSPTDKNDTPSAITIYVDADATDGSNDGASWNDAFTDLQSALNSSLSGDRIWVAAGIYYPAEEHGGTGDRYKSFQMIEGVAIYGGFASGETSLDDRDITANETILSGDIDKDGTLDDDNVHHVFYHPSSLALTSDAVLSGFTITGGYADGSEPHNSGGGMFNSGSSPTITACTFSGNQANYGGGMRNYESASTTISNCIFSGNRAVKNGGGMNNYHASPTLLNCTFSGNQAGASGGGMLNNTASPELTNCILWGDTASSEGDEIYNTNATPIFSYCDVQGGVSGLGTDNGGNIEADPLFVRNPGTNGSDDYGDLHLTALSPCIEAGDPSVTGGTDIDGEDRVYNDYIDIGSDEFPDTDGDGYTDDEENTCGSDPSDPDDIPSPTPVLSTGASAPTNTSPIPVTITFNREVTGFTVEDLVIGNGTADNFTETTANLVWTVDIIPETDGEVTVDVNAGAAVDAVGNPSSAAGQLSLIYDTTAPGLTIGAPSAVVASTGPVTYDITYSGVDTVSLTENDITLNRTGTADGSVSVTGGTTAAPSITISDITGDGTLGITIAAGTASDNAGNTAESATSTVFSVDNTAPVVTITAPADGSRIKDTSPTLSFTVTETNPGTDTVELDGETVETGSGESLGTLEFGSYTLAVTHTDAAGNAGSAEVTFDVDPAEGDLNGDRAVDLADAVIVLKIQTNITVDTHLYLGAALDDTRIGTADAVFILQTVAESR